MADQSTRTFLSFPTLAVAARSTSLACLSPRQVEDALRALGSRAFKSLDFETWKTRAALVSEFVRNVYGLSAQESVQVERALLLGVDAWPREPVVIALKDDISLVTVRNQLHYLAVLLGIPWVDITELQTALSDCTVHVKTLGSGEVRLALLGAAQLTIQVITDAVSRDEMQAAAHSKAAWLKGLLDRSIRWEVAPQSEPARIQFVVDRHSPNR
jgi:hypothetical protein